MVAVATKRYACGLCGKRRSAEQMVFSTFTHARYCAVEQTACERRYARLRKERGT